MEKALTGSYSMDLMCTMTSKLHASSLNCLYHIKGGFHVNYYGYTENKATWVLEVYVRYNWLKAI